MLWREYGYRPFQDGWSENPEHKGGEDSVEGRWLPLDTYNALLSRANTATVAADLMRARAEKAERERDAMREERDDAIGRTSMERYSDGRVGEARMESVVYGLGVCTDWYFDDYDCSVEMIGVRNGWLPTKEDRDALAAAGLCLAFLSYLDGTAVLVNLATGSHGPCSPRSSKSETSALVSEARRERAEAEARAERAEKERDEAAKVADVATDAAAKAVLDAKEVYEARHLARVRELEGALKAAIPFVEWAQFCGTMIDCRAKADEARALARTALGRGE